MRKTYKLCEKMIEVEVSDLGVVKLDEEYFETLIQDANKAYDFGYHMALRKLHDRIKYDPKAQSIDTEINNLVKSYFKEKEEC